MFLPTFYAALLETKEASWPSIVPLKGRPNPITLGQILRGLSISCHMRSNLDPIPCFFFWSGKKEVVKLFFL
jgi:hypothetical protein